MAIDPKSVQWDEAPPAQPTMRRVGPANPKLPLEIQGQQLGNARTGQQIAADRQLIPLQVRKAAAEAAKAESDARQKNGLDPQKLANIRAVQSQIDRLNMLYKQGPGRTQGMSGWLDFLPTQRNGQFDTAAAGLGEVGLSAFRTPGVGAQSDAELRAFVDANRPSSWDRDASSQEKVRNLQNRLDQTYRAYGIKRQGGPKVIDFNDLGD